MIRKIIALRTLADVLTLKVILKGQGSFFLHSLFDPLEEAEQWVKAIKIQPRTAYIVFGLGLGYHIKALLNVLPENSFIYIIDTAIELPIYQQALSRWLEKEWLEKNKRVTLIGHQDVFMVASNLNKMMQEYNANQIQMCCYYPAMKITEKSYFQYQSNLILETEKLRNADFSFSLAAGKKMFENAWENLFSVYRQHSILELKGLCEKCPVLVVSAGPSLNKNIEEIKTCKDKVVIIASGTAIGALRKHNIIPHFLVIIDPFDINGDVLAEFLHEKTVLVAPYDAPPKIIKSHKGKICFYKKPLRITKEHVFSGIEKFIPQTEFLMGHISVAVTAFALAEFMEADPVIFAGQDLAYPEEVFDKNTKVSLSLTHATGVNAGEYTNDYWENSKVVVDGFYGDKVNSTKEFKLVIDFFAGLFQIRGAKRTIINATEGGAFLPNAQHMSLHEAICKYFVGNGHIREKIEKALLKKHHDRHVLQLLISKLQKIEAISQEFIESILHMKKYFVKNGDTLMIDTNLQSNFCEEVVVLLQKVRDSEIYIFLSPFLSTIVDLFELEQIKENNNQEEALTNCLKMLSGLEGGLMYFRNRLSGILKDLDYKC